MSGFMKQWIKEHVILYKYYKTFKEYLIGKLSLVSPTMVSKIRYKNNFGRALDLKNPREFNEKLQWLKLKKYQHDPLVIQCADKVRVREYVQDCGCEEILIDCLGVYDQVEDIPWERLPEKFVLKCNHGAGYNIVCEDKSKLDISRTKKQLKKWLKDDYSLTYAEMHYHQIKPKIICEKFVQPKNGTLPDDYKVFCFYGEAFCTMLCKEREQGEHCKFYFFDKDWKFQPWDLSTAEERNVSIEKPKQYHKMLDYAEKLSKGFPFVRIDLYVLEDRIYFGEMTFTPCGCLDRDLTLEGNKALSDKIIIS